MDGASEVGRRSCVCFNLVYRFVLKPTITPTSCSLLRTSVWLAGEGEREREGVGVDLGMVSWRGGEREGGSVGVAWCTRLAEKRDQKWLPRACGGALEAWPQ